MMVHVTYKCEKCGTILADGINIKDETVDDCSKCGKQVKVIVKKFEELIASSDSDHHTNQRNQKGELTMESVSRARSYTAASVVTKKNQPSEITAKRSKREDGFSEEGIAASSLASSYNSKNRTNYKVQTKTSEDSDYQDRTLESKIDDPKNLIVQIRHFDEEVIAELGRNNKFKGLRNYFDFENKIDNSIEKKSRIDEKLKSEVILLLLIPSPIGQLVRKNLQRGSFDLRGFREVWISPLGEDCFEVFSAIPENQIAEAAYYWWKKDGPYWGNDHYHWFKAIDEIRGIDFS